MKEYTVDFESEFIEVPEDPQFVTPDVYPLSSAAILDYVDKEFKLWKDDIVDWREDDITPYYDNIEDDPADKGLRTFQIEFTGYYVQAKNSDIAWKKAEKYAKSHNLTIVEIDEGYDIDD